jgi:signal transduction histidine kinase
MKERAFLVSAFYSTASIFGLGSLVLASAEVLGRGRIDISWTNLDLWLLASLVLWCVSMIKAAYVSGRPGRKASSTQDGTVTLVISSAAISLLFKRESVIPLALFLLTSLHIFFARGKNRALAGVLLFGAAHIVVHMVNGAALSAGVVAMLTISVCAFGYWFKLELEEWERQLALYDQARKAASEFVGINIRMQDSIDRTSSTTRLHERSRIAREIHDSVGYVLTAVLVQLQAAQEVLRVNPLRLMERLRLLEDMVRQSIQEVRHEVSDLRDESVLVRAGTSRWTRLCEAFADGTGIRVNTLMSDELETVNQGISEIIYRIIQEALTNAYRHGGADYIDVAMGWEQGHERILLRISDNGKGAGAVTPGNGLNGMRERLSAINGRIVWQTQPGRGFDIGIEIPWNGDERS